MDNCFDYHYSNGLKLQVYTLAGCRMMEEIIARLDRFAPPVVQLIFAVIHTARFVFSCSSGKEVHACKLLETRDMGFFNGFGSVTLVQRSGCGKTV